MRGFHRLVVLGVFLVTLLVIVDNIDAGKKEGKMNGIENGNSNEKDSGRNGKSNGKLKKSESFKSENSKKSKTYRTEKVEYNQYNGEARADKKNYKVKNGAKFNGKDRNTVEEGSNPKITKTYQKVKKYKIVEDEPVQKAYFSKPNGKKTKSQLSKEENFDNILKTVKKNSQKKLLKEKDNIEESFNEDEWSSLHDEEGGVGEEDNVTSKRKKYKLVEVVVEEDGEEDREGNETIIEVNTEDEELNGIHRTKSEEVIEKYKTTHTVKLPRTKRSVKKNLDSYEEEPSQEATIDEMGYLNDAEDNSDLGEDQRDSHPSMYEDHGEMQSCQSLPDNPNRKGPKKLVLYVIEEEVNGQIKKRLVTEEDGVTMCEVADLLKKQYYGDP